MWLLEFVFFFMSIRRIWCNTITSPFTLLADNIYLYIKIQYRLASITDSINQSLSLSLILVPVWAFTFSTGNRWLLCLFLEIQIWPQTSHLKPWICIIAIIIIYHQEISISTTIRYTCRRRLGIWLTLYYSTCPANGTAYMFLTWYIAQLSR